MSSTHVFQKFVAKGDWKQKPLLFCQHGRQKPKRTLTSNFYPNVEFVHQHQTEIAFNCISLMECQQSIASQNTMISDRETQWHLDLFQQLCITPLRKWHNNSVELLSENDSLFCIHCLCSFEKHKMLTCNYFSSKCFFSSSLNKFCG